MTFVQFAHKGQKENGNNTVFRGDFLTVNTICSGEKNDVKKRKIVLTNG